MTAGRLPAAAAAGRWSGRASPGPGQLFLCSEGSEPLAFSALQPGKGKPNPTRAPAQPRTHRTQSSCAPQLRAEMTLHTYTVGLLDLRVVPPDSAPSYIQRRGCPRPGLSLAG